jgi:hypothetical protein
LLHFTHGCTACTSLSVNCELMATFSLMGLTSVTFSTCLRNSSKRSGNICLGAPPAQSVRDATASIDLSACHVQTVDLTSKRSAGLGRIKNLDRAARSLSGVSDPELEGVVGAHHLALRRALRHPDKLVLDERNRLAIRLKKLSRIISKMGRCGFASTIWSPTSSCCEVRCCPRIGQVRLVVAAWSCVVLIQFRCHPFHLDQIAWLR